MKISKCRKQIRSTAFLQENKRYWCLCRKSYRVDFAENLQKPYRRPPFFDFPLSIFSTQCDWCDPDTSRSCWLLSKMFSRTNSPPSLQWSQLPDLLVERVSIQRAPRRRQTAGDSIPSTYRTSYRIRNCRTPSGDLIFSKYSGWRAAWKVTPR